MNSGRPVGSVIRQNLVEILYYLGESYGYHLYTVYISIFPKVSIRSIYHHLNKGLLLNEFRMHTKTKKGEYSWGNSAEVVYYKLGDSAKPIGLKKIKKYLEKTKK